MNRNQKLILGTGLLVTGLGLIGWNLRDPDAAYREPPKHERVITPAEMPPPVQATLQRVAGNGKITQVKEKRQGGTTYYSVDSVSGDKKTEVKIAEDGSVMKQKSKKLSATAVKAAMKKT
jgi:hypothetical protein